MLTLYVGTGCPYSQAVLHKVNELGLDVEEKNIADESVAEELIKRGGKLQTPYLVDEEHNAELYESGDIVDHLERYYALGTAEA